MALLRPYEQRDRKSGGATAVTPAETAVEAPEQPPLRKGETPKKGTPTRSRAAAEAERMARLHPQLSKKELRRANAAARAAREDSAYQRLQERPERRLMQDHVDTRRNLTEFILPIMLVLMALSFGFRNSRLVQTGVLVTMMVLLAGWFTNVAIAWGGFKKLARERFDHPNLRGLLLEMNSRMMSIRRFRRPVPRRQLGEDY